MLLRTLAAGKRLTEGLGLVQCRASDSEWSVGDIHKSDCVKNGGAIDDVAVDDNDDDDKGNNNNNNVP
jgi:hypothetical protein